MRHLSSFLDCARWIAALAVAAGHVRQLVFVSGDQAGPLGAGWQAFYALTGFGSQAVIVFFVLSGYLVGGSVVEEFRGGRFAWGRYAVKRISRLYPVLLLGLVCGFALDSIGLRSFNAAGIYTAVAPHGIRAIATDASRGLDLATFAGNLFMLETIATPVLGTNGPLWSLCNEFWYYVLFPLAAVLGARRSSRASRAACAILLAALLVFLPKRLVLYFAFWLMGALVALARRPLGRPAAALGLFVAALAASRLHSTMATDFCIGGAFALLVASLAHRPDRPPPLAPLHRSLAAFSYSLYVFHFPFAILAVAAAQETLGYGLAMRPNLTAAAVFAAILASAIAYAYGMSLLSEARTPEIRRVLESLVAPRPPASVPVPEGASAVQAAP